jgi:hypothetical protein
VPQLPPRHAPDRSHQGQSWPEAHRSGRAPPSTRRRVPAHLTAELVSV